MKRIGMVLILVVTAVLVSLGVVWATEEKCTEGNFAVAELPVDIFSYPEPCSRITAPADSVIWMKVVRQPIAVKFGENKVIVQQRMFRVGGSHTELILRPTEKYEFYMRPEYKMKITDVPKHLKGGENALWYEVTSSTSPGQQVEFLSEFATQVLVPRGCNIKIMADAPFTVKYAGQERQCEPEEVVTLEGKPGSDLVEIHGLNKDGVAVIGVSVRKPMTLEQPAKKKKKG